VKSLAAPAQTLIHSSTTVSNFFCGINMICELWLHLFAGELCTLWVLHLPVYSKRENSSY
jgi:hypothetical protein